MRSGNSAGLRTPRARAISIATATTHGARPDEDLHVEPERVEQPRERVAEQLAVEERTADLRPSRCERDEHDDRDDDDHRARRGDGDGTTAARPLVALSPGRTRRAARAVRADRAVHGGDARRLGQPTSMIGASALVDIHFSVIRASSPESRSVGEREVDALDERVVLLEHDAELVGRARRPRRGTARSPCCPRSRRP